METKILNKPFVMKKGLNRTMQYGNSKEKIIPFKNKAGLNRTMQYGNYII